MIEVIIMVCPSLAAWLIVKIGKPKKLVDLINKICSE
jgi:hypothetical protein